MSRIAHVPCLRILRLAHLFTALAFVSAKVWGGRQPDLFRVVHRLLHFVGCLSEKFIVPAYRAHTHDLGSFVKMLPLRGSRRCRIQNPELDV